MPRRPPSRWGRPASTTRAMTRRRWRSPSDSGRIPFAPTSRSPREATRSPPTGGPTRPGLRLAIRATGPEGTLQSVSFYAGGDMAMPLGRLYTLGIRFLVGRAHAAALLPEVMPLIAQGRLRPEEVTTRVVDWEEAPVAYLEPAIKLVVRRS